ncbi:hypothetical protein KJ780_04290, partial [Candidatus Micrarchaeota archaeon]|nr:hypothetical protein [Candidatus Micrarchaeota archaeon]
PLVNEVNSRRLYVVWEHEEKIEKQEFAEFMRIHRLNISEQRGPMQISKHPVVQTHIANLEKYNGLKSATEIAAHRKCCRSICCVDSRHAIDDRYSGVIKLIGSLPSDDELERKIANPSIKVLALRLHTSCGYINTAIKVGEMLDEIRAAISERRAKMTSGIVYRDLERILKGTVRVEYLDGEAERIADTLGLKNSKQFFCAILGGLPSEDGKNTLDFQMVLRHMYERGVISDSRDGFFEFAAAKTVTSFITKRGVAVSPDLFAYLVTEELGRKLLTKASEIKQKHPEKQGMKILVLIDSLKNGGVNTIPDSLTLDAVTSSRRKRFTGVDASGNLALQKMDVFG